MYKTKIKDKIDISRRYIVIGFFASFVLFKQSIVNPQYQLKGTTNIIIRVFKIIFKIFKIVFLKNK